MKLQRPVPSVLGPEDQGLTVQDSVPFFLLDNDSDLDAEVTSINFGRHIIAYLPTLAM